MGGCPDCLRGTLAVEREDEIEAAMLRLVAERGADKTICPSKVARALSGPRPGKWRTLMQPVRHVAMRLAGQGKVSILRKGKPVGDLETRLPAWSNARGWRLMRLD